MTAHGFSYTLHKCFTVPRGELYSSSVEPLPSCSLQYAGHKDVRLSIKIHVSLIHSVSYGSLGSPTIRTSSQNALDRGVVCGLENSDWETASLDEELRFSTKRSSLAFSLRPS